MTLYTTNYNLDKYEGVDKPNLRDQYNSAMDKIDSVLKTQESKQENDISGLEDNLTNLRGHLQVINADVQTNTTNIDNLTKRADINSEAIKNIQTKVSNTSTNLNSLIRPAEWTVYIDEDFSHTIAGKGITICKDTFNKRIGDELPQGYAILSLLEQSFDFPENSVSVTPPIEEGTPSPESYLHFVPFDTFYANPGFTDPQAITISGGLLSNSYNKTNSLFTTTKIQIRLVFRIAKVL